MCLSFSRKRYVNERAVVAAAAALNYVLISSARLVPGQIVGLFMGFCLTVISSRSPARIATLRRVVYFITYIAFLGAALKATARVTFGSDTSEQRGVRDKETVVRQPCRRQTRLIFLLYREIFSLRRTQSGFTSSRF